MADDSLDVLIVGAGLSGIGAAWHLRHHCPGQRFAILEGRDAIGGTWDLFRYPGIRSDSDMYTLGYRFKPWTEAKSIADAPAILRYVNDTADENGLRQKIRFGHRLVAADWDSRTARWSVTVERGAARERVTLSCAFLYMCTGYYNYAEAYRPVFPGEAAFKGPIIHPQFWPEGLDYKGKRIIVIGSGATAVTLVPAMADAGAAHVTMVQRSPSFVISRPGTDKAANWLRAKLPGKLAYGLARWKNLLVGMLLFSLSQRKPDKVRARLLDMAKQELGPDFDVTTHFNPRYNPWEQRLCLVPDGDLFRVIRDGQAEVVTDTIEAVTETGLRLASGRTLDADIIISATGLKMEIMSGVTLSVDGSPRRLGDTVTYKGFMYDGLPNLASAFGYSNASWTLKADLIAEYVCRLLNRMKSRGEDWCMPVSHGVARTDDGMMTLSSGYVARALAHLPKQGARKPWRAYHNYLIDLVLLRFGRLDDGAMTFGRTAKGLVQDEQPAMQDAA